MAIYPVDPYAFYGSPEWAHAVSQPDPVPAKQGPDLVGTYLTKLLEALAQPEQDAESMVPQAQAPSLLERVQNAYAFQAPEQAAANEQQFVQREQAARQRPALVAQMREKNQQTRLGRLTQGLNAATLMQSRQEQSDYRAGMLDIARQKAAMLGYKPATRKSVDEFGRPLLLSGYVAPSGEFVPLQQFNQAVANAFIPTSGGYEVQQRYGPVGNPPMALPGLGGGVAYPPLAPGVTQRFGGAQQMAAGMQGLNSAYTQARREFGLDVNPGRANDLAAKGAKFLATGQWNPFTAYTRNLTWLGADAPKYLRYDSARKRVLNAYVKQQTGAQFSLAELARYEAMFPEPWDDPKTAGDLMQRVVQTAVLDMQQLISAYGGLQAMQQIDPSRLYGEFAEDRSPTANYFAGQPVPSRDPQVGTKGGRPVYEEQP